MLGILVQIAVVYTITILLSKKNSLVKKKKHLKGLIGFHIFQSVASLLGVIFLSPLMLISLAVSLSLTIPEIMLWNEERETIVPKQLLYYDMLVAIVSILLFIA